MLPVTNVLPSPEVGNLNPVRHTVSTVLPSPRSSTDTHESSRSFPAVLRSYGTVVCGLATDHTCTSLTRDDRSDSCGRHIATFPRVNGKQKPAAQCARPQAKQRRATPRTFRRYSTCPNSSDCCGTGVATPSMAPDQTRVRPQVGYDTFFQPRREAATVTGAGTVAQPRGANAEVENS